MSMKDDHACRLVNKGTIHFKMSDEIVRKSKEVRYITRMTRNLILVGDLEAEGLRETLGVGILKMCSGSLVVLKGIRCNNVYYLMDSTVTGLASSE